MANPVENVTLMASTTAATSGAGAVEFYRWAFSGFHLPPPDTVLVLVSVATVPFFHAVGKLVMAWINRKVPPDAPAKAP